MPRCVPGVRLVSCGADGRLVLFELLRCDGGGVRLATAAQWQAKGGEVSESPDCLGGSKHDPEFKA